MISIGHVCFYKLKQESEETADTFIKRKSLIHEHGRSARIGNVVLYFCSAGLGAFIKTEEKVAPKKLEDISEKFAIDKISSSAQYFYLSGRGKGEWKGQVNVLVVDTNGKPGDLPEGQGTVS